MAVTTDVDAAQRTGFTRSGAFGAVAWGLPIVATVVATPLVIRAVGTREYGLFVAVNGIVMAFAAINLARPVTVALARDGSDVLVPATIVWSALCGVVAAVLVGAAVLGGLGNLLGASDLASTTTGLVAVACIGALVLNVYNAATGLLPGLHRVGTGAALLAITGCATSAGYVLVGRRSGSATAMLAWLALVLAVSGAVHVILARRLGASVLNRRALHRATVVAAWPAAAPFVWAQALGGVLSVVERVGLARTSGLGEVTNFAPPLLIVVAGLGAMWSVVGAMVPQVVRLWLAGDTEALLRWVRRMRLLLGAGSSAVGVAVVAAGPWAIDLWLDGAVTVSRGALVPYALWLVTYCVLGPGMALADATGQAWSNVWLVGVSLVLMLAVGIPAMAATGAAGVGIGRAVLFPVVIVHAVVIDRGVRQGPTRHRV